MYTHINIQYTYTYTYTHINIHIHLHIYIYIYIRFMFLTLPSKVLNGMGGAVIYIYIEGGVIYIYTVILLRDINNNQLPLHCFSWV